MLHFTGWRRLAVIFCIVGMLAGCGQKGPLYLPEGKAFSGWLS